jgi:hypothetical protein
MVNVCIELHLHTESFEKGQEVEGQWKGPHWDGLRKLKLKSYKQKTNNSDEWAPDHHPPHPQKQAKYNRAKKYISTHYQTDIAFGT